MQLWSPALVIQRKLHLHSHPAQILMCNSDDEDVFVQAPPRHRQAATGNKSGTYGAAAPRSQAAPQPLSVRSLFTRPSQLALPAAAAAEIFAAASSGAVPAAGCPADPSPVVLITQPSRSALPAPASQSLASSAEPVVSQQAAGSCAAAPLSQLWGESWRVAQAHPGTAAGCTTRAVDASIHGAFGADEACSQLGTQLAAAPVQSAFCPACGCFLYDLPGGMSARASHVAVCRTAGGADSDGEASDGCRSDGGDGQESDAGEAAAQPGGALDVAQSRAKRPALRELATTSIADWGGPGEPAIHQRQTSGAVGCTVNPGDASKLRAGAAGAWSPAAQPNSRAGAEAGAIPCAVQASPLPPPDPAQGAGSEAASSPSATAGRCSPLGAAAPGLSMRLWLRQRGLEAHADAFERAGLTPAALPALRDQARGKRVWIRVQNPCTAGPAQPGMGRKACHTHASTAMQARALRPAPPSQSAPAC